MKILLYTEGLKTISKSGLGKAIKHQKRALEKNNIEYTTNLHDDFDILHVNFYGLKSYFYTKKMRKKGKKIIYHAHSTEEDFKNSFLLSNLISPLFKKWICKCYKLGDQIITPTEYSKRLLDNYNLERPIKVISNGVDTDFFECDEKMGDQFREKYGYSKDDKIIVGIGLYIERKGILDFVELAKRLPEYKFIWFGYSPLIFSPHKIKKAVKTKLDNLKFAGYVEPEIIKSALSGSDLYLFPTHEETEGIPIIEALTSKIPTLIRDIPVFEEYKENEVVYKAKNIDEFEDKIKKIINKEVPDLTESGYKLAKEKDIEIVGNQLINTYKDTLNIERKPNIKKVDFIFIRNLTILLMIICFTITCLLNKNIFNSINNKLLTKIEYNNNDLIDKTIKINNRDINIKIYSKDKSKSNRAINEITETFAYYDDKKNINEDIDIGDINIEKIDLNTIKLANTYSKIKDILKILKIDTYIITSDDIILTGNNINNTKYRIVLGSSLNSKDALVNLKINNMAIANLKNSSSKISSISVVSNKPERAIILSEYLYNLNIDDGLKLINGMSDTEAIWTYMDNDKEKYVISDNFYNLK